ncbi:hypothetical protein ACIQAL_19130 [Pseudomonas sp. NPDC088368]|jgi:hypothetical protein|uniref:hypothetical protein n=1 Tax=Pseudomonas sp. NPDC088368 TaxID=3364453 RepID=UPI0038031DFB
MNRAFAALLICASFNAWSADSIAQTIAGQASTFANATLCESLRLIILRSAWHWTNNAETDNGPSSMSFKTVSRFGTASSQGTSLMTMSGNA